MCGASPKPVEEDEKRLDDGDDGDDAVGTGLDSDLHCVRLIRVQGDRNVRVLVVIIILYNTLKCITLL